MLTQTYECCQYPQVTCIFVYKNASFNTCREDEKIQRKYKLILNFKLMSVKKRDRERKALKKALPTQGDRK